jgi:hypothetical protein
MVALVEALLLLTAIFAVCEGGMRIVKGFIDRFLRAKEPPFLCALLLAGMAWAVTHIVDRVTSAPLISYQLREDATEPELSVPKEDRLGEFVLRNLTLSTVFTDVTFAVHAQGGQISGRLIPDDSFLSPKTDTAVANERLYGDTMMLFYTIPEFHPGQSWKLCFWGKNWSKPVLRFRSKVDLSDSLPPVPSVEPSPALEQPIPNATPSSSSEKAVATPTSTPQSTDKGPPALLLEPESFTTLIVQNEFAILYSLALIFVVLLIAVVLALAMNDDAPPPEND